MSPESLLRNIEDAPTVAFHKFTLLCNDRVKDIFCFFEGKDSQYYNPRIKNITNKNCHPISCGNKRNVIEVNKLISNHSEYNKYLKAFFVDRDFDPELNIPSIFETPCYSVENFYVNRDTFSEILKNEFNLTEIDTEYQTAINLFDKELENFSNEILLFNAWYAALKRKKFKEQLNSTNVCLDNNIPKGFVTINIGSISSNYSLFEIKQKYPNAIEVSEEEVNNEVIFLRVNKFERLRGKFQFLFFYKFLKYLIEDANKNKKILTRKTKFNIDFANMYTQLSQYAITHQKLIDYLQNFK